MVAAIGYAQLLLVFLSISEYAQSESVFRVLTGEELDNLDFSQGPHLLEVAARTGENVTIPITSVSQGAMVQEGVTTTLNCTPWLNNFPGGTIKWYKYRLVGLQQHVIEGFRTPQVRDYLNTLRSAILGDNDEILRLIRGPISDGAEDPSRGIYECEVCNSSVCHSANTTILNVGRTPILDKGTGQDPVERNAVFEQYKIGADVIVNIDETDSTKNIPLQFAQLECGDVGVIIEDNIPSAQPTPTVTWRHTGLDGTTAFFAYNAHLFYDINHRTYVPPPEFQSAFPLLFMSDVLSVARPPRISATGLEFTIHNITKNSVSYDTLKQAYGWWTCTFNNSLGQDSATTFISDNCHCPILTDPDHGSVNMTGRSIIDTATYSCDRGFHIAGESVVKCTKSGSWSSTPPVCTQFRVLSGEELNNLDFSQGPHLLEVAARTGENVTIPVTSVSQGGVVQEDVTTTLDCTPWLNNFPGGTIKWYKYRLVGLEQQVIEGFRTPQTRESINQFRLAILGDNDEIFRIIRGLISEAAEDPSRGIYECEVCNNTVCHSANTTVLNVGRPPIIDQGTGQGSVQTNTVRHEYKIGAHVIINIDETDARNNIPLKSFLLECGDVGAIREDNIPSALPTPTVTWQHTGLDGTTAFFAYNADVFGLTLFHTPPLEFLAAFPLLYMSEVFSVSAASRYDISAIDISTENITKNSVSYNALKQAYGWWTCTLNNSIGQDSATTFISDNYHCPILTDPDHGSVSMTGRSIIDTATYSCDCGFHIVGESVVTCSKNGSWSSPPPVCTRTESVFRVLTGEELDNLDFSQGPHLLEVAARTGENVTIPITSVRQGAVVQEGVTTTLNCTPWLNNFPGGTIKWYKYRLVDLEHVNEGIRTPQVRDYLNTFRTAILGDNDEILRLIRGIISDGAEDPSRGIYECEVCNNTVCRSANTTILNVGRTPIIDQDAGQDPVEGNTLIQRYNIGADVIVNINETDSRNNIPVQSFLLECGDVGIIIEDNIPSVQPIPTVTWQHTGLDGTTAFFAYNVHLGSFSYAPPVEFHSAFPLLFLSDVLSVARASRRSASVLEFTIHNITKNSVSYDTLKQAYGWWTCTLNNSICQDSATTFISDNCHCPILTDPDHGSVNMTGRSIIDTATYSCEDGYHIVGESVVKCTKSGFWSSPPPVCTRFRVLSGEELNNLDFSQGPHLLEVAARTGENVTIPITSVSQGGVVQEDVTTTLDCTPWLNNFPGGTIRWYKYHYVGLQQHVIRGIRTIQSHFTINPFRSAILGNNDGIFRIIRGLISDDAEDPSRGIYECEVCTGRNIPELEECHSANTTILNVGRPPIIDEGTGQDPIVSSSLFQQYKIGADVIVNIDEADSRNNIPLLIVRLECGDVGYIGEDNIPSAQPIPTLTWQHTGLDGSTAFFAYNVPLSEIGHASYTPPPEFQSAFPLLFMSDVFSVSSASRYDTSAIDISTENITKNSISYNALKQAYGWWTCTLNNSVGQDTASTFISDNCHCPILTDPDHGSVSMTGRSIIDTATYSCDRGFHIVGESVVTCTKSGSWSSPPPVCTPSFPVLPVPDNCVIDYVSRTNEIEAICTCNAGYGLVGYPVLSYHQSSWHGQLPECKGICDATQPPTPIPNPVRVENVHSPECGRLEWDAQEGVTYKLRFYTKLNYFVTPSSERIIIATETNSFTLTKQNVPQQRPLYVIIKARNSNGVHSDHWSAPITAARLGCLDD